MCEPSGVRAWFSRGRAGWEPNCLLRAGVSAAAVRASGAAVGWSCPGVMWCSLSPGPSRPRALGWGWGWFPSWALRMDAVTGRGGRRLGLSAGGQPALQWGAHLCVGRGQCWGWGHGECADAAAGRGSADCGHRRCLGPWPHVTMSGAGFVAAVGSCLELSGGWASSELIPPGGGQTLGVFWGHPGL